MRVVYARQRLVWMRQLLRWDATDFRRQTLFLAGPTPRLLEVPSWRPEALEILEHDIKFDGIVLVPEDPGFHLAQDVDEGEQIDWEYFGTENAGCIAFWIPRDLGTMPGFTTNIEFGRYLDKRKIVVGAPVDTPKMEYIRYWCDRKRVPYSHTLRETLQNAVARLS